MNDFLSVWTPGSVLVALIGGFLLGLLVLPWLDNRRFTIAETAIRLSVGGTVLGAVFYTGQVLDTLFTSGSSLAWRVLSRFLLWVFYAVVIAIGAGIGIRRRRRRR